MITEVHVSGIFKAIKLIRKRKKHYNSYTCAEMSTLSYFAYLIGPQHKFYTGVDLGGRGCGKGATAPIYVLYF